MFLTVDTWKWFIIPCRQDSRVLCHVVAAKTYLTEKASLTQSSVKTSEIIMKV